MSQLKFWSTRAIWKILAKCVPFQSLESFMKQFKWMTFSFSREHMCQLVQSVYFLMQQMSILEWNETIMQLQDSHITSSPKSFDLIVLLPAFRTEWWPLTASKPWNCSIYNWPCTDVYEHLVSRYLHFPCGSRREQHSGCTLPSKVMWPCIRSSTNNQKVASWSTHKWQEMHEYMISWGIRGF